MSIFQVLGLGSIIGGYPPTYFNNPQALQQAFAQQNIPMPTLLCPHSDCPKCREERLRLEIEQKEIDWEKARKKEVYEKRCKNYMTKFHKFTNKKVSNETKVAV